LVLAIFMSIGVMRNTLTSDVVTNNTRVQLLAAEAAQLALRFCEDDLEKALGDGSPVLFTEAGSLPAVLPKAASRDQMAWLVKDNWVGATPKARSLSEAHLKSDSTRMLPSVMPQCLAEYSPDDGTEQVVVLTVRGFSPDYKASEDSSTQNGSVVWLQSRLVFSTVTTET